MAKTVNITCDHPGCTAMFEGDSELYFHDAWQAGWVNDVEQEAESNETWYCPEHIPEDLEEKNERWLKES